MGQATLVGSSLTSCLRLDGEGWGEFRELDLPAAIKTLHLREIIHKSEREIHKAADAAGTTVLLPFSVILSFKSRRQREQQTTGNVKLLRATICPPLCLMRKKANRSDDEGEMMSNKHGDRGPSRPRL